MNADALFSLLAAAGAECGHKEFVVIGSVSILGMSDVSPIPAAMTMSLDADAYTRADPGRVFDLQEKFGEGSKYHEEHGVYLDPVAPGLPTLPEGWESRLVRMERDGIVGLFLEPNDAAVSKLARGEQRDMRWVSAGAEAGLVSIPMVKQRMAKTSVLDAEEKATAERALNGISGPSGGGRNDRR